MSDDDEALTVHGRYARFGGMTWPLPETDDENGDGYGTQWRLRYGVSHSGDRLHAAEVMAAYEALLAKPARERAVIVRQIRRAMELREKAATSAGERGT